MRLSQLIGQLEGLRDELDEDVEVLAADQESWPLAGTIDGVTFLPHEDGEPTSDSRVVWIAIGGHPYGRSPYAPRAVFEAVDR